MKMSGLLFFSSLQPGHVTLEVGLAGWLGVQRTTILHSKGSNIPSPFPSSIQFKMDDGDAYARGGLYVNGRTFSILYS